MLSSAQHKLGAVSERVCGCLSVLESVSATSNSRFGSETHSGGMGATGVLGAGQCVGVLPCRQPMHRQRFAPVALRQASARPCARPWAAPTQRNCRRLRRLAAQAQFAGAALSLSRCRS